MKKHLLFLFAALILFQLDAQSLLQQFTEQPGRSGGVYYAYPAPVSSQVTAPPKGYHPFYISHYGRHGSRYMIGEIDYTRPLHWMEMADSSQVLTPLGKDVLSRLNVIWAEAKEHNDELAPLGKRQHRGIAERMYQAYPEVFSNGGQVTARSTTSLRCALSMLAFCERLKELDPTLNIFWETSRSNMYYLNYHSEDYEKVKRDPNGWQRDYRNYSQRKTAGPTRFIQQLFSDTTWLHRENIEPQKFMTALYDLAGDLQDMECGVTLYDLFQPEELLECWRNWNAWFYYSDADAAGNKGEAVKNCRHLLDNIIQQADSAIAGTGDAATLRFGHDGNIIPLAASLHLEHCDACISDPTKIEEQWQNFHVAPMGANIQMVFFRKDNDDDILVKVMLNEVETRINGIKPARFPFYHWKDVKKLISE